MLAQTPFPSPQCQPDSTGILTPGTLPLHSMAIQGNHRKDEPAWNRQVAERLSEGVVVVDSECQVLFANHSAHEVLGYRRNNLEGRTITECLSLRGASRIVAALEEMAKGKPHPYQVAITGQDGHRRYVLITSVSLIGPSSDGQPRYLAVFRDITRERRAAYRLKHLLTYDSLTGLYTRAEFVRRARSHLAPGQMPVSVIIADINGLKRINDAFGTGEGDKCITLLSKAFRQHCHSGIVGRWEGGTLVSLLYHLPYKRVREIVAEIQAAVQGSSDTVCPPTLSFGVVQADREANISDVLSRAEDRLRRNKLLQKDSARSGILASLEHSLWARNRETAKHTQRVLRLALQIGRLIHLEDSEMDELALLTRLYDIGKIAIPDSILAKSGPFTPAERRIMSTHSDLGYRITSSFPEMSPVAAAILAHHERWDGKGYPNGIRGKEIPITARIISICDSFDSMLHNQPYRKALSRKAALREIRANAGTQFDPEIVNAFTAVIESEESPSVIFLPGILPHY